MHPGMPLGVAFPTHHRGRQHDRAPGRRSIACRSCRAAPGSGLSGGAIAVEGALTVVMTGHGARCSRSTPRTCSWSCQPGIINADLGRRGRRARPVLPARPGQLRDLLHRRQPGRELRRPALRQVRRDARLRAGPRGRARGRRGHPDRRQERQGRHGLRPDAACSSAPRGRSASSPRPPCDCSRCPPPKLTMLAFFATVPRRGRGGRRHDPRRRRAGDAGAAWTGSPSGPSTRRCTLGLDRGRRCDADDRVRRRWCGRRGGAGPAPGACVCRGGATSSHPGDRPARRPTGCARPGARRTGRWSRRASRAWRTSGVPRAAHPRAAGGHRAHQRHARRARRASSAMPATATSTPRS